MSKNKKINEPTTKDIVKVLNSFVDDNDTRTNMDSLKFLPNKVKKTAMESLISLKEIEKERIDSGEYVWIDVEPKIGAKYSVLRHIKNIKNG